MSVRDRHIYWFKNWRWWRGDVFQRPPIVPVGENITVLDMNGYTHPARREWHMFLEWNKPKTLHEFIMSVLYP